VLEEKSSTAGMAGLASQFGLDLGSISGGTGGFFSGENIGEIIKSSQVLEEVLLSPSNQNNITLADLFIRSSGMQTDKSWKGKLSNFTFLNARNELSQKAVYDTVLLVVIKRIREKHLQVERLNKKGSIYSVSFLSTDPVLASLITERLVAATAKLYIDIKTRNVTANITKMETKADSLRRLFGAKVSQAFSYQVLDPNEAFTSNKAATEVSVGDKSVLYGLYAEVMKNLELSRLMLVSQTPVIQVLDKPEQPLTDMRTPWGKKVAYTIIFLVVAYFFVALMAARSKP
jgi:hypothetical protein